MSDAERADALARLSFAYGEGRLDLKEYERRCADVECAATHSDLEPLFNDLPAQGLHTHHPVAPNVASNPLAPTVPASGSTAVEMYTRGEIASARKNGQNMRLGLLGLGSVLSFGAGILLAETVAGAWGVLPVIVIPVLFILLYVMKVGPDDWYTPSPEQLRRQQLKEIQAARRLEEEQRKALRAAQRDQITGDAMDFAMRQLGRFNK